ncbi:MAG: XrtA system polysaccharide deacetylase [Chromatiales bacterium]
MINALSVDLEEYFQVSKFEQAIPRERWGEWPARVRSNTLRILELLDEFQCKATFFTVGWIAERYPDLVREIAGAGHEIACHSYWHRIAYRLTPAEFRADVRRAKTVLEDVASTAVVAYRAPSYSIVTGTEWAWDVLIEEGFETDSSVFPVHHRRYGIASSNRFVHRICRAAGTLTEFPLSTIRIAGTNFPFAAGGYLRFLPYSITKYGIAHLNELEKKPAMVAFHPWELDPHQPLPRVSWLRRFRHCVNLDTTERKLRQALQDFKFGTVREVLQLHSPANLDNLRAVLPTSYAGSTGA